MTITELIFFVLLSTGPGLFISWWIYKKDKHAPEPHLHLAISFILGMVIILPAYILETAGSSVINVSKDPIETLIYSMFIIALTEEGLKFSVLRLYNYTNNDFDEPMDGIVYAVMISMGFATLENIMYVNSYGLQVGLLRMFTAIPAHAAFAVLMGYYAGKAKFAPKNKRTLLLVTGLSFAVLSHGLYDFFLLQQNFPLLVYVAFIVLIVSIIIAMLWIASHAEESRQSQLPEN